jgi:hypothetical protein
MWMAFDRHLFVISDHISDERAMKRMWWKFLFVVLVSAALHKERMASGALPASRAPCADPPPIG